ncbi:MAG: class I SAM-dependent methyltransferase [Silicimonas sp.]|nr:class I SAM-dependent methyltransferase [Silicimonas sp.]
MRFNILRQYFLNEIVQYLPKQGRVLDMGCGFGLFSLYFGKAEPGRHCIGVELQEGRVAHARKSAERLGIENVEYYVGDVRDWDGPTDLDAIYLLDVVHHLPQESVPEFLEKLKGLIKPGGLLILKDVADRPLVKMWFTLILDRLMVGMSEPIRYWPPAELIELLRSLGFDVKRHTMNDILPYPHMLYVCTAPE